MSGTSIVPVIPVDYTGKSTANKITNELQALTNGAGLNFYFVVPKYAPFFEDSVKITFKALSGEISVLVRDVDYYCTHYFVSASRATGKEIFGSVTFNNKALNGTLTWEYQTLGGIWIQDSGAIATILADRLRNPRTTAWEQVVNMPSMFPVVDHEWNLVDMVGMTPLVQAVDRVTDAVLKTATSVSAEHLANYRNPHNVTAAQIGAVTLAQLQAEVIKQLNDAGANNTDKITEGSEHKFFTEARVLGTGLQAVDFSTGQNRNVSSADTVGSALKTFYAQINALKDADSKNVSKADPQTDGIGSEKLVTIVANTSVTNIDLSTGSAFKIILNASTQLVFDSSKLPNTTDRVMQFPVTIQNNGTANFAVAFPVNIKWPFGVMPARTVTALGRDEWYFFSDDNTASYTGSLSNQDSR